MILITPHPLAFLCMIRSLSCGWNIIRSWSWNIWHHILKPFGSVLKTVSSHNTTLYFSLKFTFTTDITTKQRVTRVDRVMSYPDDVTVVLSRAWTDQITAGPQEPWISSAQREERGVRVWRNKHTTKWHISSFRGFRGFVKRCSCTFGHHDHGLNQ